MTQFQFVNPHAYVFFSMQDASGKTINGRCELPAVTSLQRVGWTRTTLVPGQKILMKGSAFLRGRGSPVLEGLLYG